VNGLLQAMVSGDTETYKRLDSEIEAKIRGTEYKANPHGMYALYKDKNGEWRESATKRNSDLCE